MDNNELGSAADALLQQDKAQQVRNNITNVSSQNPDQAAQYQHLAAFVNVPVESVQQDPDGIKAQALAKRVDADNMAANSPSTATYLTDPNNAAKSHDDVHALTGVEAAVKALPAPQKPAPSFLDQAMDFAGESLKSLVSAPGSVSAPAELAKGFAGAFNKAAGAVNLVAGAVPTLYDKAASVLTGKQTTSASDYWFKNMVDPRMNAQAGFEVAPNAPFVAKAGNTAGNLLGMLAQIVGTGGGGAAVEAGAGVTGAVGAAAAHGVKAMAFPAITDSVTTAKNVYQQTGDINQAMRAAQAQYVATSMAGVVPLGLPGALPERLLTGAISGVSVGDASRVAMNMVLPQSMAQPFDLENTILSGLAGAGLGGIMGPRAEPAYNDALRQVTADQQRADQAVQGQQAIQALGEMATSSKTRERDPAAFRQLVQDMTENGKLSDVYVSAKDLGEVLNQSGVTQDQLVRQMPEVAAQIQEATMTNGDIRIPVEDYATHIAGGPVDAALLPHLKTDAEGMTFKEARDHYAGQQESMQATADKIGADQEKAEAREADGQGVHDDVLAQLNQLKRFNPDVNKQYAKLMQAFFETQGERHRMTAREVYDMSGLNIKGQPVVDGLDQANRGAYNPDTATLALLKASDLSTFTHEAGHFFLDATTKLAARAGAPESMRAESEALLKHLGIEGTPEMAPLDRWATMSLDEQRASHEQFAEGFERYLMEGRAPTIELQGLFSRFRSWLLNIYQKLSNIGTELSPEVRGIMDRMLASDAAIREAEQTRSFRDLFDNTDDSAAGREVFEKYQALGTRATEEAIADMTGRSMRDMQWSSNAKTKAIKALQKDALAKRRVIQDEVEKEVRAQPVEQARRFLKDGKLFDADGNELPDTRPLGSSPPKLDGDAIKEMYPKDALGSPDLTKLRGLTGKDGLDPDIAAEMFGLRDGHELVRQLTEAPPAKDLIRDQTDQRMLERYGELTDAQHIEQAANEAVHNETRSRFMATGLKMLSKSPIPVRKLVQAAREAAEASISGKRVRDLRPTQYLAAEARSNKEALQLAPRDPAGAVQAQRAALLNNQLFRVADAAVRDIQKSLKYLARFSKDTTRAKIDVDYRDQIDALLDRHDLRQSVSGKALDKREALLSFVERMSAAGMEPNVPEHLLNEAQRTHYKDMTVEEFSGLVDAVKSIEHLGRLKTEILDGQERRAIDALADEAVKTMGALPQRTAESNRGLTRIGEKWLDVKAAGRSLQASLLKMEQMMDWLDARNSNGVMNRVVFRRIADAGVKEYELQKQVKAGIDDLLHAHLEDVTKNGKQIFTADNLIDAETQMPQRFTKKQMLALAGNMGNESNVAKLAKGEGWNEQHMWDFLHANMTKADWDFVAGMGRSMESLWPEKVAMSRRLGNSNPDKIEPRSFDTPHGRYEGWYWPMVYDPARDQGVADRGARAGADLFENTYSRANTDTGRTITRNEAYAAPVLLSLDVVPRVLKDEIHDIAYREAIIDADKFISNKKVRDGIVSALSQQHYDQLRPWLQSIANDTKVDMAALKWFDAVAHGARTRATIVGLGYRVSTMLVHGTSAAMESIAEVGPVWMSKGLADFINPLQWTANRDFIFERSGEMANRMNEVDRDIREHLREIDLRLMDPATNAVQRGSDLMKAHAYQGIAMLDMASALPTWMAAYHKGMAPEAQGGKNMSEQDAVYFADKTVRNAHGGSGAKDMAAVQRGPEFFKLFTMFYTFWNHNVNRLMDTARLAQQLPETYRNGAPGEFKGDLGRVIMRTLIYTLGIQTIHHMMHPPKQDEGETSWAAYAAKEFASSAFAGIPILRDLSAHYLTGKDYSATPAAGMVDAIGNSVKDAGNLMAGREVSEKALKHTITTAGYVFALPTGQVASAGQFLYNVEQGKEHPQNVQDWFNGLMHGDLKKH